jgi:hypothetical protein
LAFDDTLRAKPGECRCARKRGPRRSLSDCAKEIDVTARWEPWVMLFVAAGSLVTIAWAVIETYWG